MLALSSPLYKSLQHRPSLCWRKQSRPAARVRTGAMIGNTNAAKVQQIKEMYSKNKASFPDVPDMSCEEVASVALQANNKPLIIIDTRTQEEQQVSMLPGPVLTQEEFEQKQEEFKQHEVVCYCTIGMRSGLLAKRLREQGFSAYNLEGSILGWTHHNYPLLEKDRRTKTRRVHVFGKQWALQAEGYESVAFPVPLLRAAYDFVSQKAQFMTRPLWSAFQTRSQQDVRE
ncbi:Rhodanese-like domain-containing protein [Dunaliella salina]|uniref:Rhodanese-like domain-containing protein n=1 Tax=Dunaliella salina TaxID=3046 RepID=A0ABQ7FXF4_DUNSA|nr:Rhodanese-like domain-containing protein [Dunaliella salina]|eukprot:KAF5826992.1 Rhodanese-like domain-containing protein [Dunaliella salina]